MPKVIKVEQGSAEWFAHRRGVITATRAQALLEHGKSNTKKGKGHSLSYLKGRDDAIAEIAMERLAHSGKPHTTGAALRRGHDFEQEAIDAYIFQSGEIVAACGFALHSDYPQLGCSPDGLVGDRGMVQIKVPTSVSKHVDYLKNKSHASEYGWQLFHELYVMDRDWTDIVSYCPEADAGLQLAVHRVYAPKNWDSYHALLAKADADIEEQVSSLSEIQQAA